MKRTHYIYKLPWPGNVTFRICCGSWRGHAWGDRRIRRLLEYWSIADLVLKNSQRFKANFSLNRWLFFRTRSAILEQLWAAPQ